jgi:pyruvate formate lyase activating enzyme
VELTTLLIPGLNDGDEEIHRMARWVLEHLGPEVPMHFTAFHPDWRMLDRPPTPPPTLSRARRIAHEEGVLHAYTGNVHDPRGQCTRCSGCGGLLIGREGYDITAWTLSEGGRCPACGTRCPGVLEASPGTWGARRLPVRLGA